MAYREKVKQLGKVENDTQLIKDICGEIRTIESKKANEIYLELIEYIKKNNLTVSYPLVMYKYSWVQYDLGNLEKAIKINLEIIEILREQNNIDDMLNSISFLVGLYSNIQEFDNAMKYAKIGLKVAEESGNYQKLYDLKSNIGVLYLEIEEYDEARKLYKQILKLPSISGRGSHIANIVNLSECELECGDYESALNHCNEILEMAEDDGKNTISYIKCIIGRIYTEMNNVIRHIISTEITKEKAN